MVDFDSEAGTAVLPRPEPDPEGGEVGAACPRLGLPGDPSTRCLTVSYEHRCHAMAPVRRVPVDHQLGFCLTETYERCPIWQQMGGATVPPGLSAPRDEASGRRLPRILLGRRGIMIAVTATLFVLSLADLAWVSRHHGHSEKPAAVAPPPAAAPTAQGASPTLNAPPATAAGVPPALSAATPSTAPAPRASDLADDQLLRPGAQLVQRTNVALDGSPVGQAIVASSATAADGCQTWFLDIYASDGVPGRFRDVFDAGSGLDAPRLLGAPTRTGTGCAPTLAVLGAPVLAGGNAPEVVATITQADGSVRVVTIGWQAGARRPAVMYDKTFPSGTRATASGDPAQLIIDEPADGPNGAAHHTVRADGTELAAGR